MDINPNAPTVADLAGRVKVVRGDVTQFDDVIATMLAEKPERVINPVSYTHLDVYKRQRMHWSGTCSAIIAASTAASSAPLWP